jgi:hypothetical protein
MEPLRNNQNINQIRSSSTNQQSSSRLSKSKRPSTPKNSRLQSPYRTINKSQFSKKQHEYQSRTNADLGDSLEEKASVDTKIQSYVYSFVSYPIMQNLNSPNISTNQKKPRNKFLGSISNSARGSELSSLTASKGKLYNDHKLPSEITTSKFHKRNSKYYSEEGRKKDAINRRLFEQSMGSFRNGTRSGSSINDSQGKGMMLNLNLYKKKITEQELPILETFTEENKSSHFDHFVKQKSNENFGSNLELKKHNSKIFNEKLGLRIKKSFTISKSESIQNPKEESSNAHKMIQIMKSKEDLYFEVIELLYKKDINSLKFLLEYSKISS